MKKFLLVLSAVTLVFGMVGSATAALYTSTFDGAGDFSLGGFSTPGTPPIPTNGPDSFTINNLTGTYSLDVPPAGTYNWYVELNSLTLDLDGDSTPEFSLGHVGPVFVGTYAAPGLTGAYDFGYVYIPPHYTYGGYTLNNLIMGWDITIGGTDITQILFTITADNLVDLNTDLTSLDNTFGGTDGVIDGHATADFSVTAAPVPIPAAVLLLGSGFIGLVAVRRRFETKANPS